MLREPESGLTEAQKEPLLDIHSGVHDMASLVATLLDVSKIQLGTFIAEIEKVHIVEVMQKVLREAMPQIRDKKLKFVKVFDNSISPLMTDNNIVKIVIQNLLSNAIKYTPHNGIITLKVKDYPDKLIISIADTGWGIPADQKKKIFTQFFRASNITMKDARGTGLGLYLSKLLLKAVQGEIWFTSKENKGSTFFVSLPHTPSSPSCFFPK
jgi:two-component system sensor histidine kinase VicK